MRYDKTVDNAIKYGLITETEAALLTRAEQLEHVVHRLITMAEGLSCYVSEPGHCYRDYVKDELKEIRKIV